LNLLTKIFSDAFTPAYPREIQVMKAIGEVKLSIQRCKREGIATTVGMYYYNSVMKKLYLKTFSTSFSIAISTFFPAIERISLKIDFPAFVKVSLRRLVPMASKGFRFSMLAICMTENKLLNF
jgi:hypothetical protein